MLMLVAALIRKKSKGLKISQGSCNIDFRKINGFFFGATIMRMVLLLINLETYDLILFCRDFLSKHEDTHIKLIIT